MTKLTENQAGFKKYVLNKTVSFRELSKNPKKMPEKIERIQDAIALMGNLCSGGKTDVQNVLRQALDMPMLSWEKSPKAKGGESNKMPISKGTAVVVLTKAGSHNYTVGETVVMMDERRYGWRVSASHGEQFPNDGKVFRYATDAEIDAFVRACEIDKLLEQMGLMIAA